MLAYAGVWNVHKYTRTHTHTGDDYYELGVCDALSECASDSSRNGNRSGSSAVHIVCM